MYPAAAAVSGAFGDSVGEYTARAIDMFHLACSSSAYLCRTERIVDSGVASAGWDKNTKTSNAAELNNRMMLGAPFRTKVFFSKLDLELCFV